MFVLKRSTRHVVWRLAQLIIAGIQIVEGQRILSSRKGAWKRWTAPLTVVVATLGAIVEEGYDRCISLRLKIRFTDNS